jgi:ubiquinone/menaquinone biosynthesis C-methylase UbiE
MKLNLAETLLVNNPVRGAVQRYYEAPLLRRLAGRMDGARVLEIGCGNGNGLRVLHEQFGAAAVIAAGAVHLPFPDATFDAVFDFGVLHHVPNWQAAVAEIRRVLRPGAPFLFEEVTRTALNRWLYRTFLHHPRDNRFSEGDFLAELAAHGIVPRAPIQRILSNDIFIGAGFVAAGLAPQAPLPHRQSRLAAR